MRLKSECRDSSDPVEARAWNAFDNVVHNFLGKMKSESYRDVVEELLSSACKNSGVGWTLGPVCP